MKQYNTYWSLAGLPHREQDRDIVSGTLETVAIEADIIVVILSENIIVVQIVRSDLKNRRKLDEMWLRKNRDSLIWIWERRRGLGLQRKEDTEGKEGFFFSNICILSTLYFSFIFLECNVSYFYLLIVWTQERHQRAPVAQWIERLFPKQKVVGSTPTWRVLHLFFLFFKYGLFFYYYLQCIF